MASGGGNADEREEHGGRWRERHGSGLEGEALGFGVVQRVHRLIGKKKSGRSTEASAIPHAI